MNRCTFENPSVIFDPDTCECAACTAQRQRPTMITDQAARDSLEREILMRATVPEVLAVRAALRSGHLYNTAESCVIGRIACMRGTDYAEIDMRAPLFEAWLGLHIPYQGITPARSDAAARLETWLNVWIDRHTLETEARPRVFRQRSAPDLWSTIPELRDS